MSRLILKKGMSLLRAANLNETLCRASSKNVTLNLTEKSFIKNDESKKDVPEKKFVLRNNEVREQILVSKKSQSAPVSTEQKEQQEQPKPATDGKPKSFEYLLKHSKFIELGDFEGNIVPGTIVDVVGDDLYIDFGFKFLGVCKVPFANSKLFVRGAKVSVRIKDLEICDRFLGSPQDMTLLEADITLLDLQSSPLKQKNISFTAKSKA